MKKSNTLMISYMIFLVISLLANMLFEWKGLDRIAMAATIAGCFFAIADLCNWEASFWDYSYDKLIAVNQNLIDLDQTAIKFVQDRDQEMEYIIEQAKPYRDKHPKCEELIATATDVLKTGVERREYHSNSLLESGEMSKKLEKEKKKSKRFEKAALYLMVWGFVLFFSIIVFDYFVCILTKYQTWATIVAFVVIMYNYYAKDVIEENQKMVLEGLTQKTMNNKFEMEKLVRELQELNLSDQVDSLIESIEKKEKEKLILEANENGQT